MPGAPFTGLMLPTLRPFHAQPMVRRCARWLGAAFLCCAVAFSSDLGFAEEAALPINIQAELLGKVAGYDRNFAERAGDRVHIGLLVKPDEGESLRSVAQMQAALSRIETIAGLPHDETTLTFSDASALPETCRQKRLAILFISPGFRQNIEDIRRSLEGVDVLTATGVPEYVKGGIVLGFDVAAGRPQLLVHLTQARKQKVALRADVLRLMKVYE